MQKACHAVGALKAFSDARSTGRPEASWASSRPLRLQKVHINVRRLGSRHQAAPSLSLIAPGVPALQLALHSHRLPARQREFGMPSELDDALASFFAVTAMIAVLALLLM